MTKTSPTVIDRDQLISAFDQLGHAAVAANTLIDVTVYGGSALMFASNFRFASGDVDIAPIKGDQPKWFSEAVAKIATELGYEEGEDWLNDAVGFHLSKLAEDEKDHFEYGTFPRTGETAGLRVFVPTADYMLALKLKAIRVNDVVKGDQERIDIQNLLQVNGVKNIDEAIGIMGRFFPVSAKGAEKQRFYLAQMFTFGEIAENAPVYPVRAFQAN